MDQDPDDNLRNWLRLSRTPALGGVGISRLIEQWGSASAALAAGQRAWARVGIADRAALAVPAADDPEVVEDLAWLSAAPGRGLITCQDPDFPARLREIPQAPACLFYRGHRELMSTPQLAVVGARSATPQGLAIAHDFAATLAASGITVTSGLALGIDGAAHKGALSAPGGTSIAICGTGLDRVYPAAHRQLAAELEQRGLLLSEFVRGTGPKRENFPRRNRLLSGLSLGVLVVEAARESGSLITARLAAEQGREVFAIPGSIHNPLARGCHQLIRQGAKLVESVDDILLELAAPLRAWLQTPVAASTPAALEGAAAATTFTAQERRVLDLMGDAPVTSDFLALKLGWPAERLLPLLLELELAGHVSTRPDGSVMRLR